MKYYKLRCGKYPGARPMVANHCTAEILKLIKSDNVQLWLNENKVICEVCGTAALCEEISMSDFVKYCGPGWNFEVWNV